MKLMVFITVICVSFFALQTPCTALQIQLQSSNEQAKGVQLSPPTLPRKLRFTTEEVALKGNGAQHSISNTKQKEAVSGHISGKAPFQKEETRLMHGSGGTRKEWVEAGHDISHYFTMDYSHVRRRRPIHNKSLPVGP